ncbi:MAG: Rrf2 family transcriptional regulator [Clostridiales bacterium]|jgi:Rrf2 family protein|nr:Rrf2 family transcriptional regulator [Clostridiales bacterium]
MRLSAKARYGLSALISMASSNSYAESVTVVSLANKLDISKIYLEQVFSLLKRAGLVTSIKGAQGGYQLSRRPQEITAYEILAAIETSLFEKTEFTEKEKNDPISITMKEMVFEPMDCCLELSLANITLEDLSNRTKEQTQGYMYYL